MEMCVWRKMSRGSVCLEEAIWRSEGRVVEREEGDLKRKGGEMKGGE